VTKTCGLVCPNGHCMDEGYLHCPCCGAYRPPRCLTLGMTMVEQMEAQRFATDTGMTPAEYGAYREAELEAAMIAAEEAEARYLMMEE
jgi:hypothetical protein